MTVQETQKTKPTKDEVLLLLRLYELRQEPLYRQAFRWFISQYSAYSWEEHVKKYLPDSEEERYFHIVLNYWEMVAALVNHRAITPELFFDSTHEDLLVWEKVRLCLEGARSVYGEHYLANLETLVKEHQEYISKKIKQKPAVKKILKEEIPAQITPPTPPKPAEVLEMPAEVVTPTVEPTPVMPVRRKRGRPPKVKLAEVVEIKVEAPKRKRGRPPKQKPEEVQPVKRKRGRPPKTKK